MHNVFTHSFKQSFKQIYNITSSSVKLSNKITCNYITCNYINCQYNDYTKLIEEDVINCDKEKCIYVCENCGLFLSKE